MTTDNDNENNNITANDDEDDAEPWTNGCGNTIDNDDNDDDDNANDDNEDVADVIKNIGNGRMAVTCMFYIENITNKNINFWVNF